MGHGQTRLLVPDSRRPDGRLCQAFIEGIGACGHTGADAGDTGQLAEALDGAVLTAGPVENGKNAVKGNLSGTTFAAEIEAVHAAVRGEQHGHQGWVLNPGAILNAVGVGILIEEPAAFAGDADGPGAEAFVVDVAKYGGGGEA